MATGRLGVADLSATTNTTIYTVPTDNFAVVTVNVLLKSQPWSISKLMISFLVTAIIFSSLVGLFF